MAANDYAFVTRWRLEGTVREVHDILADAASLPRWWPSVYLEVRVLQPGNSLGVGKTVELLTQGWLPYRLRWRFVTTDVRPDGFTLDAMGDFEGRGVWTFAQARGAVDVTYDWRIRARKPLLRSLSWFLKPVFAANHRWAMARGEESLALELRRRRARTEAERAAIPDPPAAMRWGAGR
jgi:hypothetical protein